MDWTSKGTFTESKQTFASAGFEFGAMERAAGANWSDNIDDKVRIDSIDPGRLEPVFGNVGMADYGKRTSIIKRVS
tara:strand:+ start:110 stop:337 length:228 start_codon:yes stop_codon:yes gene_type:complete